LVLENTVTKNSTKILTAKSVNFHNFTLKFRMTIFNNQTKMTKSMSQKKKNYFKFRLQAWDDLKQGTVVLPKTGMHGLVFTVYNTNRGNSV